MSMHGPPKRLPPAYRPEYIDTKSALKIIEEALRAVKRID